MDHKQRKDFILASIEDEFGEPFEAVVQGFRAQGATWPVIAGALEISTDQLKRWATQRGLHDGQWNREAPREMDRKAQALGYPNATEVVREYISKRQPLYLVAQLLGCHPHTVYDYTPEEFRGGLSNQPTPKRKAYLERVRTRFSRRDP